MTADQLGDNRPQLPKSDDELARHLRSLAHTIRTIFNDSAFDLTVFERHPVKIPSLEDIINLFELEKSIFWRFSGKIENFFWGSGKGIIENFTGFDNQNRITFNGELITHFSPDQYENVRYWAIIMRKPLFDGSERYHQLSHSEHIEEVDGTQVSQPDSFYYYDGIGNYALVYKPPFSQQDEKSFTKTEVQATHSLYRPLLDLPSCPYPNIVFPGNLCLTRCWLKLCPRGLGPFDPGPHNPSAPNDPRGRDPRGLIDPRGPR